MGDRAVVIFKNETEVGPGVYLHWQGSAVPELIEETKVLMEDRRGDVDYGTARFVGFCHADDVQSLSLGVFNVDEFDRASVLADNQAALEKMSPGDAGLFIVDTKDYSWVNYSDLGVKHHE